MTDKETHGLLRGVVDVRPGEWLMATKLGLGLTAVSFIAAPLMGLWLALALWLGWQFRARDSARLL